MARPPVVTNRRSFLQAAALGTLAGCALTRSPQVPMPAAIELRLDFRGAEALLEALERSSIADADIDALLAIRGVAAMVDNTTKYIPADTRAVFRAALKEYVASRRVTQGHFGLGFAAGHASDARRVIAELEADARLAGRVLDPIRRYQPDSGPLAVTVYCVAGGASDGFVLDRDPEPAFFMAVDRSQGDVDGVMLNMSHELYHVAQRAARARVAGLTARVFDEGSAPAPVRLLTTVLDEGSATYVADATRFPGSGPYLQMWRSAYARNAAPERIAANFALFDRLLAGLRSEAMTWSQAYEAGFAEIGPPLYFVGVEMSRALDKRHGPARMGRYFGEHPAAFFRDYIVISRAEPGLARFSAETEAYAESLAGRAQA
jgi:hypothetical protein